MCGIAGITTLNEQGIREEWLHAMCSHMLHRGPDDEGYFTDERTGLGMRRLNIIDIETGKQPISNEDSSIHVIQNGEIYNYVELRADLINKGHSFRTNSDTEVIVHAYEEYGPDFVDQLNGMFAIAIWDSRKKSLYLYRDRLGEKPLYYYQDDKFLVFASEMQSILASGINGLDITIDHEALNYYLIFGAVPAPYAIIKNIKKLLPGHYMEVSRGKMTSKKYWDVLYEEDASKKEADILDEFADILDDSVRIRLRSDVPLGAFLSGGVDSSAIVACAAKQAPDISTFSIGYRDDKFDESRYAKDIADHLGVRNETLLLDNITPDEVISIMSGFDEPFYDSSAIPTYYVSKLARAHVTVALSGDGGDELFSGYSHYRQYLRAYNDVAKWNRTASAFPLLKLLENSGHFMKFRSTPDYFCKGFSKVPFKYRRKLIAPAHIHDEGSFISGILNEKESWPPVSQFSCMDLKNYLPNDILTKVDRMSMKVSLEVRVPLLDYRLVEFAAKIPQHMKFSTGSPKQIFKDLIRKRFIRDEDTFRTVTRPKHGFKFPLGQMLNNDLKATVHDHLLSKDFLDAFGFPGKVVRKMLYNYYEKRTGGKYIWTMFCLSLWHQRFRQYITGPALSYNLSA
ncbi:MAG: asparagine synthase (glutamine-hydrolyzing) [Nitrospirota bacterium]|nr:asparagine synthase (glutamine-hydrolyzing) [Nitrospirota bacterium]